ncbi:MAG: hypothetical protein ACYDGR_00515 [Candidatus Dormibacteria bacterium]
MASLLCGAAWFGLTQRLTFGFGGQTVIPRVFHLGFLATIVTGVAALALGFLLMGFLWLALDLSLPVPAGVDPIERETQLFVLWLGIPLAVIAVLAVFALIAVVIGRVVYAGGLRS